LINLIGCYVNPYQKQQQKLAEQLGVKISDYPYPVSFPESYFVSVLQPGMTPDEVHKVIQGYEKVLNCGNASEIYYYFSMSDDNALRFEVFYGIDKFKFEDLQGEDTNSRTIRTVGCTEGLVNKPS